MEGCHEGICGGEILEAAALLAAIRVPVTEAMPSEGLRKEHLAVSVGCSISSP